MGHDRDEHDDLPAREAPRPDEGGRPSRPPRGAGRRGVPRRWRLGRIPTVALVLLTVVTGSLQLSLDDYARSLVQDRRDDAEIDADPPVNALPEGGGFAAVDPPAASGAWPPYPLNHTFDAAGETTTGSPPTNHDFETAPTTLGTPPANAGFSAAPGDQGTQLANPDFATGDFTGWTPVGTSTTIQTSGGPSGVWAQMAGTSNTLTTAAFTPEADAQVVTFDLGQLLTTGNNTLAVYALTRATYGTTTLVGNFACANCNQWSTQTVTISPYRGQSIKLRFTRASGTIGIDNVRKRIVAPGYEVTGKLQMRADGGNAYADAEDLLTTSAFTVDATAQFVQVRLRQMTPGYGDQLYLNVLSGAGYATSTRLVPQPGDDDAWITFRFNAAPWLGQSIKLQVDVLFGRIGVDDVGVQRVEFAGWTVTGAASPVAGASGGTAALVGDAMTSPAVTLPADAQQLSMRYRTNTNGVYWDLLSGPGFATVHQLSGGLLLPSATWTTWKAGVSAFAGQTVKLRVRAQLQAIVVDDVGVVENVVPGWGALPDHALAVGEDGFGTYVTSWQTNGAMTLKSSVINPGIVDRSGSLESRTYVVGYTVGPGTNSFVRVSYTGTAQGATTTVLMNASTGTPNVYQLARVTITDTLATAGTFSIQATGGARLYSIGDNVARQQLNEPFSQQVGLQVDTSTGSFGMTETDLSVEGGPLPLVLARYYAAHADRIGSLGYRWTHSFETELYIQPDGDVAMVWGSGKEEYFDWFPTPQVFRPTDARVKSTLAFAPQTCGCTYVYTTKDEMVYAFTGAGKLISIKDKAGVTTLLLRDAQDRVQKVRDFAGRDVFTLAYDGSGRLATATDVAGNVATYSYDAQGDLYRVDKPMGGRMEYAYSRHRLTEVWVYTGADVSANQKKRIVLNTLDRVNRVTTQKDENDNTVQLAYQSPADGATRVTDQANNVLDYYFDRYARTTYVDYPGADAQLFTFDATGNLAQVVDGANHPYVFQYDPNANLTSVDDPLASPPTILNYTTNNRLTRATDAFGIITNTDFNLNGDPTEVTADWGTTSANLNLRGQFFYQDPVNPRRVTKTIVDPTNTLAGAAYADGPHLNLVTTYAYDAKGNRTQQVIDPGTGKLNLTWNWTWTVKGSMVTEQNPRGHTTTYSYDFGGRMTRLQNALGNRWNYSFDIAGELLYSDQPGGAQELYFYLGGINQVNAKLDFTGKEWDYVYTKKGQTASVKDPVGNMMRYVYDASGRVSRQIIDPTVDAYNVARPNNPLNIVVEYTYNEAGLVSREVVDPGASPHLNLTTDYTYDAANRLTGKKLPNLGVWTYTYDANGNKKTEVNPLLKTTTYSYDRANRLVLVEDPSGVRTRSTYDKAGRLTSTIVDPGTAPDGSTYPGTHLNLTTTYLYDAANRLLVTTDPNGNRTRSTYDANGNTTSTIVDPTNDPAGTAYPNGPHKNLTTVYEYDQLDRLWRTTDPLNRTDTTTFDALNRPIQLIRGATGTAAGVMTQWRYDAMGHVTKEIVDPALNLDGTARQGSPKDLITSYEYDDAGRKRKMTNPLMRDTLYAYDGASRLTQIKDALNGTVGMTYDAAGRMKTVTNPAGVVTSYEYDGIGNVLTETIDPGTSPHLARATTSEYDAAGRRTRLLDPRYAAANPQAYDLRYTYDDAGRPDRITSPNGATVYVDQGYDTAGRRTTMADETGTTTWSYDPGSRVTSVAGPQGTIGYTYDAADRRWTMTLPGSKSVTYGYDDASQLTSVTDWQGRATTYQYTGYGALRNVARSNNVLTLYGYDTAGRLELVEHAQNSTLLARYAYLLDKQGSRTQVSITGTGVANGTETYGYDQLDRLTSWGTTVGGAGSAGYTYDAAGNRKTVTSGGVTTTYAYDTAGQLTGLSGGATLALTYDKAGNRLTTGGAETLTYDWRSRLKTFTAGGSTVTYGYNGEDVRATRRLNATAATPFLWDTEAGLPELVDDGATVYLQPQGDDGAEIAKSTDAAVYPLVDALGSVRAKTSGATGAVVATADFDPWGAPRATSGGAPALGFAGEQRDAATGLTHLRARDYDPLRGQFLGRDAVSPNGPGTQGYSAYAYTAGNPVSRTDPSGHEATMAAGWGLAIAGLYGALQAMLPTFQRLDQIPEAARGLVRGLLLLGLAVLRQMLVVAIVNFTVEAVGARTGVDNLAVGRALLTLGVMQLFASYRAETKACVAASWRACVGLFQMLPLLPAVQCAASLALFASDYQAVFQGGPVTEEEAGYMALDTVGLAADCAGVGGTGKGGGGGGDGPDKPRDGNEDGGGGGPDVGCNSFPAGTGVLLADGSSQPIEKVEAGERVWSADPATGDSGAREVTDAWHHADGPLVTVYALDASGHVGRLTATADHSVWEVVAQAWEPAGELGLGDALKGADGSALTVLRVEAADEEAEVWDLTVAGLHAFYVASGDGWALVHNCAYRPAPDTLSAFPDATLARGKTPRSGGGGNRKRWVDNRAGRIYEWDYQHGTVEAYDMRGRHLGEFDAASGRQLKGPDNTRRIER